ncbi:MAG TPA: hypothetical protein PKA21_09040 [Kiritimatiellia bacterium]|nr:hypothetical protein [Kiritimatiellia bacterium]HMP35002.1 hypothetical protein [Kiritimatiellia bacterium]
MTREQYKNQMRTARVIARQTARTEPERRQMINGLRLAVAFFGGRITEFHGVTR